MYRFVTKSGLEAWLDPTQVRSKIPCEKWPGCTKLILDGGHSVVVRGTVRQVLDKLHGVEIRDEDLGAGTSRSET